MIAFDHHYRRRYFDVSFEPAPLAPGRHLTHREFAAGEPDGWPQEDG